MSSQGIEDTAELRPIRRDPSWFILAVAVFAAIAFVAGAYWSSSSSTSPRRLSISSAPPTRRATPHTAELSLAASAQSKLTHTERSLITGDYFLIASTSERLPSEAPVALPASAPQIFIHYSLPDWPASARPEIIIERDGEEVHEGAIEVRPSTASVHARGIVVLRPPPGAKGFAPGIYLVHLRDTAGAEEVLSFAVISDLEKILAQQPPPGGLLITDCAVTPELTPDGAPKGRVSELVGPSQVYFWFAYDAAVEGAVVEVHWFLDGQLIPPASSRLHLKGGSGTAVAFVKCQGGTLPAGKWSVGVYLEGGTDALSGAQFVVKSPENGGREVEHQ